MRTTNYTGAIDALHAECLEAQTIIALHFRRARRIAATWEPRPCPEDWSRGGNVWHLR